MASILIVVETPIFAEPTAITCLLDRHGVTLAEGAEEALRHLAEGRFDLILVDMRLPIADGCSLIKALRAAARQRRLPILVTTAWAGVWEQTEFLKAGASCILTKPYRRQVLGEAIEGMLAGTVDGLLSNSSRALRGSEAI